MIDHASEQEVREWKLLSDHAPARPADVDELFDQAAELNHADEIEVAEWR